jgi:hypothetical protein
MTTTTCNFLDIFKEQKYFTCTLIQLYDHPFISLPVKLPFNFWIEKLCYTAKALTA